ncbi:hypothetical protein NDU88_003865 [Pleurodeles waltl]|uniref:Uncharacterized protein n=1 Tax=Pleurodeles waltl TaxID=8319 RepID=A0AAV7RJE2_PLEWA|nr:hypothetical protein NDU88_003865 [Pleurodeles waltl]
MVGMSAVVPLSKDVAGRWRCLRRCQSRRCLQRCQSRRYLRRGLRQRCWLRGLRWRCWLQGGGMSLPPLRGTLAALMVGALHDPAVAGTTVPGDVVTEVLGWDLESLALGEGQGGGVGKRSMLTRKSFLGTLGRVDGGGLGVEVEVVVVGGVRLLNLGEGAWAGGCCEVDGCWVGVCLRMCTLGGGLTDTLVKDTGDV